MPRGSPTKAGARPSAGTRISGAVNGLRADPDSRRTFLVNDKAPDLYSIIRNPDLARALRLIQQQGRDAFYKGDIAAAIVAKVQANGGVMNAPTSKSSPPSGSSR